MNNAFRKEPDAGKPHVRFLGGAHLAKGASTRRASSEGRAIRQVELLSNKLLTTAFEASLGCVAVMRRAKRRQRGSRDSYRAPKYQQTRASTLWSEGKTICGFIVKVRFHTTLRCRRELFMLYKDCTSTGESLYFPY